ncbi:hypothetical protein J4444_01225 [Candidatus Woesearchaeota archaeon]|nr:hypothetical protein [Candidatus Woesearchaeota archaeon]
MNARNVKKIIIEEKTGNKYLIKDLDDDFHTSVGIVLSKDLRSNKSKITSNKGAKFTVIDPFFPDLWEQLQRGPQVMIAKDIGLIMAKTGVGKNSKCVDAGGGSGSLCLSLANICKEITTYEANSEHYEILLKNKKLFGAENLMVKKQNIYQGITETELDLITLDLPEPWLVLQQAQKVLKEGGFLAVYLPNIIQAKQFIDATYNTEIRFLEMVEVMERKWLVEDKILRPEFQMLGHTGFLIFCRRL